MELLLRMSCKIYLIVWDYWEGPKGPSLCQFTIDIIIENDWGHLHTNKYRLTDLVSRLLPIKTLLDKYVN